MSSILECIRTVGRGERGRKPLSFEQAKQVMTEYLAGDVGEDQMAMLLMLIRVQNETIGEVAGFVQAFQSRMPDIDVDIDWPCYAGKRLKAGPPWHLLSAKILADKGYKVLLHGHHHSGAERYHAQDYLAKFNIRQASQLSEVAGFLAEDNIAYLPLEVFAPEAKVMMDYKLRYGLRTPIHTVVRALNPGMAALGIRGSFHPGFQELHARVEQQVGTSQQAVISFKGQSGESEYNPKVSQTVWLSSPEGVSEHYWPQQIKENLPQPKQDPFNTADVELPFMANTVVSSMAAVLYAQNQDQKAAFALALAYWAEYCQG